MNQNIICIIDRLESLIHREIAFFAACNYCFHLLKTVFFHNLFLAESDIICTCY